MSIHESVQRYVGGFVLDTIEKEVLVPLIEERLNAEALASVIMSFNNDGIDGYD